VLSKSLGGRTREVCNNIVIGSALASLCLAFATVPARSQCFCIRNNVITQSLPFITNETSFAGQGALESQLEMNRDIIQGGLTSSQRALVPLGYASDPWSSQLAYTDDNSATLNGNPLYNMYTKAPYLKAPAAPAGSGWGVWGQGYFDYQERSGTFAGNNIGQQTTTSGGIAGIDKTFTNIGPSSDVAVIGLLTGELGSWTNTATGDSSRVTGPSVGAYAMYVHGRLSADTTFKADFLSIEDTAAGVTTAPGLTNYTTAADLNYKIDLNSHWWVEPTVGVSDVVTDWNSAGSALGLTNGNDVRLQGGVRFGTSNTWNNIPVAWTVGAYAYDDVQITGTTLANVVAPLVPSTEGLLFGKLTSKLNFDLGRGLSTSVEAEIRGTNDIFGAAGRVGIRYQW
jgi:outer membrane autotransporter protein